MKSEVRGADSTPMTATKATAAGDAQGRDGVTRVKPATGAENCTDHCRLGAQANTAEALKTHEWYE